MFNVTRWTREFDWRRSSQLHDMRKRWLFEVETNWDCLHILSRGTNLILFIAQNVIFPITGPTSYPISRNCELCRQLRQLGPAAAKQLLIVWQLVNTELGKLRSRSSVWIIMTCKVELWKVRVDYPNGRDEYFEKFGNFGYGIISSLGVILEEFSEN